MATNALREQLRESREKQINEHEAYLCEKDARQSAEEEVQKLKSDLVLLLHAEHVAGPSDARIHQLTSKAAGDIMDRERSEIDALTKSLEQMMQGTSKLSKQRT